MAGDVACAWCVYVRKVQDLCKWFLLILKDLEYNKDTCSGKWPADSNRDIHTLVAHGQQYHRLSDEKLNLFGISNASYGNCKLLILSIVHEAYWEERNPEVSNLGRGYGPAEQFKQQQQDMALGSNSAPMNVPIAGTELLSDPFVSSTMAAAWPTNRENLM